MELKEEWKDIENYPNYQVSNLGRIKSKPRQRTKGGILKTEINKIGYEKVGISNEYGIKTFSVHRLVAKAFLNNYNEKLEINHIDGNKQNNIVTNLEVCSHSDNVKHRFRVLKQEPFRKYKEEFDWNTKDGVNKYARIYYQKNKEKILEYGKQWRSKRKQFQSISYKVD